MKESMLARLIKRIGCLFGNHIYKLSDMEFFCYGISIGYGTYNVRCKCLYCGKEYDGLVDIPFPDAEMLMEEVTAHG